MTVVFDTNVWLSELGLTTSAGSSVRFYLRRINATVALPEVVRLEAVHNLEKELTTFVDDIRDDFGRLLAVFGSLREIVLPTPDQIRDRVGTLFSNLSVPLVDIPFSLSSARSSLQKTIEGMPPSGPKNQQFKDGVLWADCVNLLATDDVCLVTTDGGFYKNRKPTEGLAENLLVEATTQSHQLKVFALLADFLADIRTDVQIDKQMLADSYLSAYGETPQALLGNAGYRLGGLQSVTTDLFITENPDRLFVQFVIEYQCVSVNSSTVEPAVLMLHGEGTFSPSENRFIEFSPGESQLAYTLADGRQETRHNYVLRAEGITIGHRTLSHSIRTHLG
jgi:PIN domain